MTGQKVALVIGVTGIVGNYLASLLSKPDGPGGPWKIYGLARRPKPDFLSKYPMTYVQCNLLDKNDTIAKLSPLHDVTHMFFCTWVARPTEEEQMRDNGLMLQGILDVLLPHAKNLQHIVLQTGGKQYTGPFTMAGKVAIPDPPFMEDMPRIACDQYYHTLEDITFEAARKKHGLTYSIHRPTVIFGFASGNLMNMVGTLAVYASICAYEGKPLVFPGNQFCYDRLFDASDAELIAEQEIWACVEPKARNQAYNTSNGDVFQWKRLWFLLAEQFKLKVPEYKGKPTPLAEMMKGKESVWDKIVKEKGLRDVQLDKLAHWWFADILLNQPIENVSSMNKSREHGFLNWRNSETSFLNVVDKMRENKLIP